MVGDTSDYVKLLALVKKKVDGLSFYLLRANIYCTLETS
jgi:hypothetical protein